MKKYGFYNRLSRKFPSQVMVDITEVCNLGCIHCAHPKFKISTAYNKRMLSENLNKKMVDEVAKYGKNITKYIRYTSNGEPLVHPKSYEMIQYAVEKSGTKVTLTTNGTLLNEKNGEALKTGLHMIDISLDAFSDKVYKSVRIGGDLKITKKNVLRLLEINDIHGHKTKMIISFVEQKENSHEISSFKISGKKSVDEVLIRTLHTNSGSNLNYENLGNDNVNKNSRMPCLYPWERVILTAKGTINFCPTDWFGKSEVSDYNNNSIKEIWNNNFYNDLRKQHLNNKYNNMFCKNCPDWKNTSWPYDKNSSYADLVEEILYK